MPHHGLYLTFESSPERRQVSLSNYGESWFDGTALSRCVVAMHTSLSPSKLGLPTGGIRFSIFRIYA